MRHAGQLALVTGAASGIGRAAARRLAAGGARVACADLAGPGAVETARLIASAGGEAIALALDVTDAAACDAAVTRVIEAFGGLTTLVNSAGVRPAGPDRLPVPEEWQRVLDVNLTGTYLASRASLPALEASGRGAIVNLASIYGLVGGSLAPGYAASKGAVVNLTRQLALGFAPRVRVNCVCPGVVETPMTEALRADPAWRERLLRLHPLGRFARAEEIAAAIAFLASDEASFVTGVALPVDGGYTAG